MQQVDIANTIAQIRDYDYGRPTTALLAVEKLINDTQGNRPLREQVEKELTRMLQSAVSFACKQFVCQKLWIVGTVLSVPVLESMLTSADSHVVEAACYALSRHNSPAVAKALRNGLSKANGKGLISVINLAGDRRDPDSVARLTELAHSGDGQTADAAIAALGKIASPSAIQALTRLHSEGGRNTAAAHALLQSGQELAARGKAAEARSVYQILTASSEAPHIRRGASLGLSSRGR
jgi:HEAT repeat protein